MDTATGRYVVTTASSSYDIDLDLMLAKRNPGLHDHRVAAMRHDGATLPLLALAECTVGRPLAMFIYLAIPKVPWTLRVSTDVRFIEPVNAQDGAR
jgi:hypothetical protein